jgi:hypothetical protein
MRVARKPLCLQCTPFISSNIHFLPSSRELHAIQCYSHSVRTDVFPSFEPAGHILPLISILVLSL